MNQRGIRLLIVIGSLAITTELGPRAAANDSEQLWHHRNLGKAFYENPTTQYEAVEQFRLALELAPDSARERLNYALALLRAGKAADGVLELEKVQRQDPAIPHTWFNLGIQYKKRGTPESNALAIAQFEKMIALVPDEAISHYNLGYLYKISGRPADALKHFETAARLDPNLAGPHFQLYNAYRDPQVGRPEDAARELATFQAIKRRQAGAVIPEDLEWSFYSEIWDPIDPGDTAPDAAPSTPSFRERDILRDLDVGSAGVALLDADADGRPDAVVWSSIGVRLVRRGETVLDGTGLDNVSQVVSVAPGDFDNDGFADLAVVTRAGASLWRNTGTLAFAPHESGLPSGPFVRAFWLDYDHDYDLDLILLGRTSHLLRNTGSGGFTDVTKEFPFLDGQPLDATPFEAIADTIGHDLVVSYADRPGVLYRDRLAGKYEAVPIDALPAGARSLVAADVNRDSWMDLAAAGPDGALALVNHTGTFSALTLPASKNTPTVIVADFDNAGVLDLIDADRVLRWTSKGVLHAPAGSGSPAAVRVAADFDADGRTDMLSVGGDGAVRLGINTSTNSNAWVRVSLTGVKNLKAAPAAEVEVKAGSRYLKAIYQGVPLLFGLGGSDSIDTVRITWPNGLIQNETRQSARQALSYKEAPRLSGSCPMVFTWDGTQFRFITDVLGVAPLGVSAGDGDYFPVDSDEYVHLPGDALALTAGRYEVRVTEELREVAYIDRVQLIAVDYPSHLTIVTNDKFKGPPFPEFRLFGVDRPIPPRAARDHRGADVLDLVRHRDRRYPASFRRDFEGVAEMHHLELDFGEAAPDGRAVLVLSGWVDWADGSTFRGVSQEPGGGLVMPYLQVRDSGGAWKTVIEDMGIPAGKPKSIAVDLTGKFLSASREIRIVTNLCVYWDRIYLSERTDAPGATLTPLDPASAVLRFRGFSRPIVDPERKQPESFEYADWRPHSMWNPTPGLYTRFGDVRALLTASDDRLVVMGSGDEIRLLFEASSLPGLRAGWSRDFLLLFVGWAKDGDANTAFSQTVEPLPFHGMSAYPYTAAERFPHHDYVAEYNTRPALRILRPLPARKGS